MAILFECERCGKKVRSVRSNTKHIYVPAKTKCSCGHGAFIMTPQKVPKGDFCEKECPYLIKIDRSISYCHLMGREFPFGLFILGPLHFTPHVVKLCRNL